VKKIPFPLNRVSAEFRLVAACSWAPRDSVRQAARIAQLTKEALNWNEVTDLISLHGVVGVFCLVMGKYHWENVPVEIKKHLTAIRLIQAAKALGQTAELSHIVQASTEAGIDLIPLKGVALSAELYGDPIVRSSGDLDILVRAEDVFRVEGILKNLGYRHALGFHTLGSNQQCHIIKALHHHEYINIENNIHVELHWRGYLWSEQQASLLWEDSFPVSGFDGMLRHLSKFDNILFLADHGARHGWQSLKWLSDLAMLAENLSADEWEALYERAAFFDLQRVLLQTLLLLEWFYEIAPPARFSALIAEDRITANLSVSCASVLLSTRKQLAVKLKCFIGPRQAFMTKMLKPSTSISIILRNVMIKPEDFLEFPLPNCFYWLYPLLRPLLWFRRHYMTGRSR